VKVTYGIVSPTGQLIQTSIVPIPQAIMMHDFAITEHFAIFFDLPLLFSPREMVKSGRLWEQDENRASRFGIVNRYSKDVSKDIRWFTSPSCFLFHTVNAWEEGDGNEIVLLACRRERINLYELATMDVKPKDHYTLLYEWRFNLINNTVQERALCDIDVEFPRIHPGLIGRPTRYSYTVANSGRHFSSVIKFDHVANKIVGCIPFGENRQGGECVFVPRTDDLKEEDDGYLMTFMHDATANVSEYVVWNAKTMAHDPVATVKLPVRIPFGFHGLFVTEEQIASQTQNKIEQVA